MSWTAISFAYGSVLTSTKMTQLYDDISALADSGAPTYATHKQIFTASGTWTKPPNVGSNTRILVELWGAGGGGGGGGVNQGGGGGGGHMAKFLLGSQLGAAETITIGAGGTPNVAGGNTSIGSVLSAAGGYWGYGGAYGCGGGYGGGAGYSVGDSGGSGTSTDGSVGAGSGYLGGGGGGGSLSGTKNGASSSWGGGGGGGSYSGSTGGGSFFAGAGGGYGVDGTAPSGGGGYGANGARGECRITVFL